MLKETIMHEAYKDGKYTDEPSSIFLYTEEKKKYAGVYCYFLPFYKNYKNIVIVKEINYSNKRFAKKQMNENFIEEILLYIKDFNKKWNENFLKVFILNWLKKDSYIKFDGDEYLVYDI